MFARALFQRLKTMQIASFLNFFRGHNSVVVPPIERILKDKDFFREFIYTPQEVASLEIENRMNNQELKESINKKLKNDLPDPLKESPRAVLFRQTATPNYELRRFMDLAATMPKIRPLLWEYQKDKFISHNEYKHSLGKLRFYEGTGKKGGLKIERKTIIDFNYSNGKKMHEIKTIWGANLTDFHHTLFKETYHELPNDYFYDGSSWFNKHGKKAKSYYDSFMFLFLQNGILFESFLMNDLELPFTREVFLPAFIDAYRKTGYKPLIVELEPIASQEDEFWVCHPAESRKALPSSVI
jgi:hypothetical protein